MDIELSTAVGGNPDEDELRALRDWLAREQPELPRPEFTSRPAEPGTMGPVMDTLQVALGTGGALTVLAGSVTAFIRTRRPGVKMRLTRPDGETLEIDASVKDPDAAIEQFLKAASE